MLQLLRSLPRPRDLQRDCEFRRSFYAVWGKVSAVIDAQETDVQYIPFEQRRSVEFAEHLRPHDRLVTPVLKYIAFHVRQGVDDEAWYEEQLSFLLERMLSSHRLTAQAIQSLAASRPGKRQELYRRLNWGRDYIHSNYQRPITIDDMASAACLSKYHFIRLFHALEGVTPYRYLQQKRVAAAQRLLSTTQLTHVEIAEQVGFDHRSTMFRQIRRLTGRSGRHWRGQSSKATSSA